MTLVEPFLGCSNRTGLPERTKLMRQMVGRLVTCSRRKKQQFLSFNTTQTTDASIKNDYTVQFAPRASSLQSSLLCSKENFADMPWQEFLILDYSVPSTVAMKLICHVSSLEPSKEERELGLTLTPFPLWRGIWAKEYHDSSCHCPPCTNTLCSTLSAIFPVLLGNDYMV